MVFSRKTGIRTEVQIISLRKKGHSKRGSNREKEDEWLEKNTSLPPRTPRGTKERGKREEHGEWIMDHG
jgi:hypothetical protein